MERRADARKAVGELGRVDFPIARLFLPTSVDDEDIDPHAMCSFDLGEDELGAERFARLSSIDVLASLLEVPGVVVDERLTARWALREVVQHEISVDTRQVVDVARRTGELKPDRREAVDRLAGEVVPLHRATLERAARVEGKLYESIRHLRTMLVRDEHTLSVSLGGDHGAHQGAPSHERGCIEIVFCGLVAVTEVVPFREPDLTRSRVIGQRNTKVRECVTSISLAESPLGAIAQAVGKPNHRGSVVETQDELDCEIGVGYQHAPRHPALHPASQHGAGLIGDGAEVGDGVDASTGVRQVRKRRLHRPRKRQD